MKKQERLEKKKRKAVALMEIIKINDEDQRGKKRVLDLDSEEETERREEVSNGRADKVKEIN